MDLLKEFYTSIHVRDAVKDYIIDTLEKTAIKRTFDRKPVDGLADARDIINAAFNELHNKYGVQKKKKVPIRE